MAKKPRVWPFPQDSTTIAARKVALAYRNVAQQLQQQLKKLADDTADPVAELDRRFYEWGVIWHTDTRRSYDPDDYVDAKEAATILPYHPEYFGRLRNAGRLPGVWVPPGVGNGRGRWYYKVADLYSFSAQQRTVGWNFKTRTDTVPDSASSDPQ